MGMADCVKTHFCHSVLDTESSVFKGCRCMDSGSEAGMTDFCNSLPSLLSQSQLDAR
jgi:hypothetical protein